MSKENMKGWLIKELRELADKLESGYVKYVDHNWEVLDNPKKLTVEFQPTKAWLKKVKKY